MVGDLGDGHEEGMKTKTITGILMLVMLGALLFTGAAQARTSAAPRNTSPPTITGTAREGNTLTAHNGGWGNSPPPPAYHRQRSAPDGSGCPDNAGATTASATSDQTGIVTSGGGTTTVTTTVRNHAPTLTFISLRRIGTLIYSRFRVCDDSTARLNVTERDTKPGVAAYTRHFLVQG